ncbi:MAG: hypothetical protein CMB48_00240 [Euryarchaeota archaeon]|nr:hypothetical protein [Euryarchaeota archaeon]
MNNNFLAEIVKILHILLILYMTFGWITNNLFILYSIVIMAPLFHIHWKTNNGKCELTNIEKRLRNNEEKEGTFIGGLSKKYLKIELTDKAVSTMAYTIMYTSALISLIRLFEYYGIIFAAGGP